MKCFYTPAIATLDQSSYSKRKNPNSKPKNRVLFFLMHPFILCLLKLSLADSPRTAAQGTQTIILATNTLRFPP